MNKFYKSILVYAHKYVSDNYSYYLFASIIIYNDIQTLKKPLLLKISISVRASNCRCFSKSSKISTS